MASTPLPHALLRRFNARQSREAEFKHKDLTATEGSLAVYVHVTERTDIGLGYGQRRLSGVNQTDREAQITEDEAKGVASLDPESSMRGKGTWITRPLLAATCACGASGIAPLLSDGRWPTGLLVAATFVFVFRLEVAGAALFYILDRLLIRDASHVEKTDNL